MIADDVRGVFLQEMTGIDLEPPMGRDLEVTRKLIRQAVDVEYLVTPPPDRRSGNIKGASAAE